MPNVSDIIGKGFKYEQVAEEQKVPPTTGTVATILGAAHWGPIDTPIRINTGLTEFRSRFGDVSSDYDEGHQAALYHYARSSRGYFTRIADGNEVKSYYTVKLDDTGASSVSDSVIGPDLAVLVSGVSDALAIDFDDVSDGINETVNVTFTGTALATNGYQDLTNTGSLGGFPAATVPAIATQVDYELDITIDGVLHQLATISINVADDWTTIAAAIQTALQTATGGTETVALNGTAGSETIRVTSADTFGTTSTVLIAAGTAGTGSGDLLGVITALGATYTATVGTAVAGLNSDEAAIVSQINAAVALNANLQTAYESYVGAGDFAPASVPTSGTNINKLVLTNGGTGADNTIVTSGTFTTPVPMTDTAGTTGKNMGTFLAIYAGRDGDRIRVVFNRESATENVVDFYFRGQQVAQFVNVNFDFTTSDANFIGNLVNNDPTLQNIVEYLHGQDETGAALSPAVLDTEIWPDEVDSYLANGASGDAAIDVTTDLIPEITKYDSVDVYNFDLISTPGYYEEAVQDAIQTVCETRQDALGVLDTPMVSVTNVINWSNGLGGLGRTTRINNKFGAWYFPYVKVRKKVFTSSTSTVTDNVLNDYSPLTRVIGSIAQSDALSGSTFAARAGIRTQMADVEGFHVEIGSDDRKKLYGDVYDGIINPLGFTTEDGFTIEGQKTGLRKNANGLLTAESRINVIATGLFLKREIYRQSKFFFWNPADPKTQADFKIMIEGIMKVLEEGRAIEPQDSNYPWLVTVDSSNNTPLVTSQNGLVAEISWYAIKTVERIKVVSNILEKDVSISFV